MAYFMLILKVLFILKVALIQIGITKVCPEGLQQDGLFCYKSVENTAFPLECPFKSTKTIFAADVIFNQSHEFTWVEIKRDATYCYFEYPKLHPNYGYLFNPLWEMPNDDNDDCLLRSSSPNLVKSANCNNKFRGVCVYSINDTYFCDAYNKICKANCHCRSNQIKYLCQLDCSASNDAEELDPSTTSNPMPNDTKTSYPLTTLYPILYAGDDCSVCDEKFEHYPRPEIILKFDGIDSITVEVKNPLKLIPTHENMQIFCFSDVAGNPVELTIKLRYSKYSFTTKEESESKLMYSFKIESLAVGYYWCEGFSLPDAEKVESNKVLAGMRSSYGLNFVLNFTFNEFHLAPYNIHMVPIFRLHNITNRSKYQLIRLPELPHLGNDRRKANLTVHLTTFPNIIHPEAEYQELSNILKQSNFKYFWLGFSDFCLPDTTSVISDSLHASWPMVYLGQQTPPKEILLQKNGLPITRRCQGSFMKGAYWSDVIGEVSSVSGSEITDDLHELVNSNKTAEEINRDLWDITSSVTHIIAYDVHLIAQIFGRIAQSKQTFDPNLFIRNVNSVTEIDSDVLQLAQDKLNSTDVILYNIDLALGAIANDVSMITTTTKNLMVWVMRLNNAEGTLGFAIYQVDGRLEFKNLTNIISIDDIDFENLQLATFIPSSLLNQIFAQNKNPSLIAAVYINDVLFRSTKTDVVGSFVLSIYITGFNGVFSHESFPIIFSANSVHADFVDFHCGFWEYGIDEMMVAIQGHWRKNQTPKFYNDFKFCNFSHMTHFAILVNAPHNQVLDLISLIGCVLSIFGIISIVITAFAFKTWRDSAATKILLNLSANILAQMLLLFLWNVQSISWCKIIAIGLHYIVISQFCWMLIIGYLQYRKFVQVLLSEPTQLLLCSYFTGWLIPIIPVAITYSFHPQSYAEPNHCYLVGLGLYFGLFLPIGCVILSNITIFFLIFASLSCTKIKAFGGQHSLILLRIKLCVILFFLLGFSWFFGLLAHFFKSIVLSYMFCVTTTTQGFVLYIYFVVCNKTTRTFWTKKFTCYRKLIRWAKTIRNRDKHQVTKPKG